MKMEEIYEKSKQLKMEILDLLDSRIKSNPTIEELLLISKIINEAEEDTTIYARSISKLYSGGMALGFGGSANSNTTVNNGESTESQSV
jgi:hypothetical protein